MPPHHITSSSLRKGSPIVPRPPDAIPVEPDATAGDVLAEMIQAHRRGDHRSAKRHRQSLRQDRRLDVTLGRLDPHTQAGEWGFTLDLMVRAMAKGDYRLAEAHRKGLLKVGVAIVPLAPKAEKGAR